jgi:hypothetical protein
MNPQTREKFLAELGNLGLAEVKERLTTNVYLGPWRTIAQGWVERREAESSGEQLTLARQAYKTAQRSTWIAIAALVIAAISMIGAIAALFKRSFLVSLLSIT